jgi:hypothetical protein
VPKPKVPQVSLAHTSPDPLASLRCAAVVVPFAGVDYTIPALPAARWLEILLAEKLNLEAIFPGLAGLDAELAVNMAIASRRATVEDLEQAIYDVLEVASGRQWWITVRLCISLRAHWEWVGGAMARNGLTPFEVPLAFWLDGAYATMVHEMVAGAVEEADLNRIADWSRALTSPPTSQVRGQVSDTVDRDAFLALARQHAR